MGVVRAVGEEYINMSQAEATAMKKVQTDEAKLRADNLAKQQALEKAAADSLAQYKQSVNEETELGALENLKSKLDQGLILEEEYALRSADIRKQFAAQRLEEETAAADAQKELDDEVAAKKMENAEMVADFASQAINAVSMVFEAAKNRELAAAGNNAKKREEIEKKYAKKQKKIAIVSALINGALGITKAFAQLGPIAGIVGAALVAATTAAQIAVISSQSFAKGGIVAGASTFGDNTLIRANAGEMILNKGQQSNLFKMLNSGGRGGGGTTTFVLRGEDLVAATDIYNAKLETY